ncbi:MAG: COX15/CtaA family protein [Paracoccaceae bacterium]
MAKRAVFEDVTDDQRTAPGRRAHPREARGAIALWLWSLAALVFAMILIGGLTRLTDSGLSITTWDPVMGVVPPFSEADWQAAFAAYQTTEEFRTQNHWMALEDFKPIYWWEWGHRMFGRVIGLVWAVGFVGFLATRTIPSGWTGRLLLPGALGGLQGAVGWWMVASGLDKLDVESYRLATHLGLAFVIMGLLAWYAMKIRLEPVGLLKARRIRADGAALWAGVFGGVLFVQILSGALVAGIDAGRSFVDWPLMQGQWIPPGWLALEPIWRNFFENAGTVQFVHRLLGYAVWGLAIAVAWRAAVAGVPGLGLRGAALLSVATLQVVLGIVTVMHAAPLELAIIHQGGAVLMLLVALGLRFRAMYPPETRIAG